MTFDLAGLYHIGMVVPDVHETMDELSSSLGLTWAKVQNRQIKLRYMGEPVETELLVTYSMEGPMHVELIRVAPGTPWHAVNQVHHFGYWTDDLHGVIAERTAGGMVLEGTYDDPSGEPLGFGYLLSPTGLRLEFVDSNRREAIEAWIAGADSFPAADEM